MRTLLAVALFFLCIVLPLGIFIWATWPVIVIPGVLVGLFLVLAGASWACNELFRRAQP